MCRSTVDIQSAAAEIRRGNKNRKKEERKKEAGQIHNVRICYAKLNQDNTHSLF